MNNTTTFGGWLRQRRKERGLTLDELADRISCSRITLIKIEVGERRPSHQLAQLLAEQFNIPLDEREAFAIFARTGGPPIVADSPSLPLDAVAVRAPWRAAHLHRTNMPSKLTRLIGREQDEVAVRGLLLQSKVRLLTLTGPPGIGKTRLALQAASGLLGESRFEDGVFLVELALVSDPDFVLPTIAQTLGLKEIGSQSIEETLMIYVRQRRLLLVLDNVEQVLDAAPRVVKLLESSPWSKALVTSRQALHVTGERRFPVPPLELPDPKQLPSVEALAAYSAVELFVERAQAVAPRFALVEANREDVAAVCWGLEGLPLAIELAAARADHLTPHQIRNALHRRLSVLIDGARDVPPRHRTLEAAIAWSYDLLNEGEKKLFRRVAVFVGGRTVEAVDAVCNSWGDLEIDTLAGLESLVDKNLLRQETLGAPHVVEARFVMLEMIREFALDRLEENAEAQAMRDLHADYYVRLLEEAESELHGPEQISWLDRLEMEHDNIRASLRWVLESNAAELGLRMVGSLRWFWTLRSHVTEGLRWADAVLSMHDQEARSPALAKALWSTGALAWLQGAPEARPLLEQSVAIWREIGDKQGLGHSLLLLGISVMREGQPQAARALVSESVEALRTAGDRQGLTLALGATSTIKLASEDIGPNSPGREQSEHRAMLEEAVQLAKEAGDKWSLALVLRNLGWLAMRQGDNAAARPLLEESMSLQEEMGTRHEVATTLRDLAQVAESDGNLGEALALYERSFKIYRDCGDKHGIANSMTCIGEVAVGLGNTKLAADVLLEALQTAKELGSARHSIAIVEATGWLMAALGQPTRAGMLLSAAQAQKKAHTISRLASTWIGYNSLLASARAQVDELTWQQVWIEGGALGIEEALQFASESLEVINLP